MAQRIGHKAGVIDEGMHLYMEAFESELCTPTDNDETENARLKDKDTIASKYQPCPYDPKHMVKVADLARHMKICNARPKPIPVYQVTNLHLPNTATRSGKPTTCKDSHDWTKTMAEKPKDRKTWLSGERESVYVERLIERLTRYMHLRGIHEEMAAGEEDAAHNIGFHPSLSIKKSMVKRDKHVVQQASLIHLMEKQEWLQNDVNDTIYAEFGAGTGELSYYVAKAIHEHHVNKHQVSRHVLVDRKTVRKKYENKINRGYEDRASAVRLTMDIKDLHLPRAIAHLNRTTWMDSFENPVSSERQQVLVLSKHLCGAATDLTLRCLHSAMSSPRHKYNDSNPNCTVDAQGLGVRGLLIALCCHHVCQYDAYVNPSYLREHLLATPLLTAEERDAEAPSGLQRKALGGEGAAEAEERRVFHYLRHMSSWAICGERPESSVADATHLHASCAPTATLPAITRTYTHRQRAWIGRACKRLLDDGRIAFIQQAFGEGYCVKRIAYATRQTTLENNAILVYRNHQTLPMGEKEKDLLFQTHG